MCGNKKVRENKKQNVKKKEWSVCVAMLRSTTKKKQIHLSLLYETAGLGGATLDGLANEGTMDIGRLVLFAIVGAL